MPDLVHISRPYCTEGSYQNYPQREITHDGGLENFIRGTGITLASEFSGVCIHRTSSVYTHTHTPRESRHTLDSLFILVSRDWVVFLFFFRRKESRTGFFLFAGVTQVQFTIHTHRDVGKLPTEQHGRRQSRHSIAEKLVT